MNAAPVRRRRLPVIAMPATRAECQGPGLCLKLSCRLNVVLDVRPNGSIRLNAPVGDDRQILHLHRGATPFAIWTDRETGKNLTPEEVDAFDEAVIARLAELDTSCALDIAERGGMSLAVLGERLGYSRELIRQIELSGLRKARHSPKLRKALRRLLDDE